MMIWVTSGGGLHLLAQFREDLVKDTSANMKRTQKHKRYFIVNLQLLRYCESRKRLTQFDLFLSNHWLDSDVLIGAMPNQCNLPISSTRWGIGLIGRDSNEIQSPNWITDKDIKHCITWSTCVSEQSHRQNDTAVSPAALQQVRSDESRPQPGGLGSPNHIKDLIKIKPLEQGCHITSRDVTFNAEILHHGHDIIRAQFEQDQPPEYALTRKQ